MSSILKALEKVEEAQSGRRSGAAGGFIKQRQRRAAWVLPVGVLGGAVVAAVATFAAMGGFSRHHAQTPQNAAVAKVEPAASAAAPAVAPAVAPASAPVQQSVTVPQPVPAVPAKAKAVAAPEPRQQAVVSVKAAAVPAKQAAPAKKVAEAHPAKPASGASTKAVRPVAANAKPASTRQAKAVAAADTKKQHKTGKGGKEEKSDRNVAKAEQRKVATAVRPVQARVQSLPPQPVAVKAVAPPVAPPAPVAATHTAEKSRPKVTGIAWQNDSASSVAMVNGRSVQQGATVDGYKVEQIFEDKVRFSSSSGKVEVPLGAGQ